MTVTPLETPSHYSPIIPFGFGTEENDENIIIANTPTMSNIHSTAVLMSDLKLVEQRDSSPAASFSSVSNSSTSSMSGRSLANAIAHANASPTGIADFDYNERASIETPFNETPYVVESRKQKQKRGQKQKVIVQKGTDQELARWSPQHENSRPPVQSKSFALQRYAENYPHRIPQVTAASVPFQNTIPLTSCLREELEKDPAYMHALKAGTLWQSLIGQHVKLPAMWYDGDEPARPYLGCEDPLKRNKWSYFGRHRVGDDKTLNGLVKNSRSSGKLLLHIICRDSETFEATEDIVVGVFHPLAEGIKDEVYSFADQQRHEGYRDVWIGHRSRSVPQGGRRVATRIESLLRYLNKNKVHKSPLAERKTAKGFSPSSKRCVDNNNMNAVFGNRRPKHTLFVPEESVHSLLMLPLNKNAPSTPASIILLRNFLR